MNKFLAFLLIFLLIIIAFEWRYFNSLNTYQSPSLQNLTQPTTSPLKILYQAHGDKEGRTVIFSKDQNHFLTAGDLKKEIGVIRSKNRLYIVGVFTSWVNIEGTADKYLILKKPNSQDLLVKIRIGFERSNLLNNESELTRYAIEDVKTEEVNYLQKKISQLTAKELNNLIKQGDSLVVLPLYQNNQIIIDDKGNIVGTILILRRIN